MPATLTPQEFVQRWRKVELKERSAYQQHFIDLCGLVGHPTPVEDDPTGERFTFEAGVTKQKGGSGWADVWKKGHFGLEYKGKHANLGKAYDQLLQYRESLENPPLLVVSDLGRIIIHTNFTNTVKQVIELTYDDLLTTAGMQRLRDMFYTPEAFKIAVTTAQVTQDAAKEFARLADHLRKWNHDPTATAHFLIRLLFCLFSEDVGLLPAGLFSRLVDQTKRNSAAFTKQLRSLFGEMASGGWFGADQIPHFNGRLFDNDQVLELDSEALDILVKVSKLDWSSIEPAIFGTLFERSLDPAKRSQLGAHYTSKEDILLIVEPVLMTPLRRQWAEIQQQIRTLATQRDQAAAPAQRTKLTNQMQELVTSFASEIAQVKVLDPACGSGNFLYVALKQLLDLEKEVITFAVNIGLTKPFPQVGPEQLRGIEINEYAHELAQITVWIGYIQWLRDNGFGRPSEPILKPLDTIKHMDAILSVDDRGQTFAPVWPDADIIIGNPPFLGGHRLREELGDEYVHRLLTLYDGNVPATADLVCYWFNAAHMIMHQREILRVGFIATNSIRGGSNRRVLQGIKLNGDIFMAWSDRGWILEGAAVRVAMIGFDNGKEDIKYLNGMVVPSINPDLTSDSNLTTAITLEENKGISFKGIDKTGPFELSPQQAHSMLSSGGNPNNNPNSDVIKRWRNGSDITGKSRAMWIIDFGVDMSLDAASEYEIPFKHVLENVKPQRDKVRRERTHIRWWIFSETRPGMRIALSPLKRYIATSRVAKHRIFVWLSGEIIPDSALVVFARDDDYFFGVLHSRTHELWALRMGTSLEDRPRYTATTTFQTFPFPWPPGHEPADDPRVHAIAEAARELVQRRDNWLNPQDASDAELKQRTLTKLYNERPTWLDNAHKKLDKAVFAAYDWPDNLSDEEILERVLALNLQRAQVTLST